MKRLVLALAIVAVSSAAAGLPSADDAKIDALQQDQARAWNAHNIKAYSDLFTSDAHIINVFGWHWRSRAELEDKLGRGFRSVFAQSQMTIGNISIEYLKPDIAVAHVSWTMTGAASPTRSPATAPTQGIQMQVLVKQAGVWRIAEFQNTNSLPERPFPTAP